MNLPCIRAMSCRSFALSARMARNISSADDPCAEPVCEIRSVIANNPAATIEIFPATYDFMESEPLSLCMSGRNHSFVSITAPHLSPVRHRGAVRFFAHTPRERGRPFHRARPDPEHRYGTSIRVFIPLTAWVPTVQYALYPSAEGDENPGTTYRSVDLAVVAEDLNSTASK